MNVEKLLFTPVSVVSGVVAGIAAKKAFDAIWARIDDDEAPQPAQVGVPIATLVASLALQGVVQKLVKGLVDRGTREAVAKVTGNWPGEGPREKDRDRVRYTVPT